MHTVAVLAFDGVVPFDLATPCEIFGRARLPGGAPAYRVRVCSHSGDVDAGVFRLRAPWTLGDLAVADTIVVPGCASLTERSVPASAGMSGSVRRGTARPSGPRAPAAEPTPGALRAAATRPRGDGSQPLRTLDAITLV